MSNFTRKCPICNITIGYSNKYIMLNANRKNSNCRSCSRKGENNPMFGKFGELNPFFNKHHTEETKQKMREDRKGKVRHCKKWIVTYPDGVEETVENMEKFCREHDISFSNLHKVVRGIIGYKLRRYG